MNIDNNIQSVNQSNSMITATDPKEENLSWLQEFHATKITPLAKNIPEDILDDQILLYKPFDSNSNPAPWSLRIEHYNNPGWIMNFMASNTCYQNNFINNISYNIDDYDLDWCFIGGRYDAISGPLYLNVILYFFKKFIEGNFSVVNKKEIISKALLEQIRNNNSILSWLEDFYLNSYYDDKHPIYGYKIISTKSGWIFYYYSDETDLCNKPFREINISNDEGTIKLYKACKYKFIIRAHSRGLIEGLRIFKEWVES